MQPLWETVWRVLKTARRELPSHPAVALLGVVTRCFTFATFWNLLNGWRMNLQIVLPRGRV